MNRFLPGILAMAAIVVASNILVQFVVGDWLTWGAFTYPLAFLVTDVMNRVYGPSAARRVVLAGFVTGVACSLVAAGFQATTLRIAIASGTAFLIAQLLDVAVFDALRGGRWWRAPLASTIVGSTVDTALFFTIAFAAFLPADANTGWANEAVPLLGYGPVSALWISLASADWLVKLGLALLALVPFRLFVRNLLRSET
ncbi:queuosine precursor transporter [Paracoccus bogoriensis]|uniref:queuosine precursor transporter n=1 Tax=Paracoccus bogoriensis TaxID=242065 RepID=UPI001CA48C57|nr:queuosine precursor transporter [Paracoccus bogoriensis]MBW7056133.1 queuosine precursor transporter [Paracoccus bogoriensis]